MMRSPRLPHALASLVALVIVLAALLAPFPAFADAPSRPEAAPRVFEVRCRAGVPFRWRVEGGADAFHESRNNREHLAVFDASGKPLVYEIEVDASADWWHRYQFAGRHIRGIEFYSAGYEFEPFLVVDRRRITMAVAIPFALLALLALAMYVRTRRLGRQLAVTHERLSEAEAQAGLFPVDGSMPTRIDRYEVMGRLGMGGMALVYRVRREGQEYALKLPLPNLLEDEVFRARFVREMKLGSTLQHPNLVQIYDVNDGQGDFGYPYLVMELINGLPLKERMQLSPLDVASAGRLGIQMLDALAYIHGRGIVHRDVKPSNVMVTASGNAKLMDFGIAYRDETRGGRVTGTGDLLGTPLYLAPEQVGEHRQSTDSRVDIYGVGVILFEMLAGRLPWNATDSVAAILEKVSTEPQDLAALRADLPPDLAACVMQMMARDPEERYSTAVAARDALKRVMASVPARSSPSTHAPS